MEALSVTTTATKVISAGRSANGALVISNDSDTDWRGALGDANGAKLTASLGFKVPKGGSYIISGRQATLSVYLIHGGSGTKTGAWQYA